MTGVSNAAEEKKEDERHGKKKRCKNSVNLNIMIKSYSKCLVSRIGKLSSLNKSLSLELETPTAYFDEESLGKIYIKVRKDVI